VPGTEGWARAQRSQPAPGEQSQRDEPFVRIIEIVSPRPQQDDATRALCTAILWWYFRWAAVHFNGFDRIRRDAVHSAEVESQRESGLDRVECERHDTQPKLDLERVRGDKLQRVIRHHVEIPVGGAVEDEGKSNGCEPKQGQRGCNSHGRAWSPLRSGHTSLHADEGSRFGSDRAAFGACRSRDGAGRRTLRFRPATRVPRPGCQLQVTLVFE
jgi:hypothetical protein